MMRVVCFVRPHRLEHVKSAVAALGVNGMSVTDVRGAGDSPSDAASPGGIISLPIRSRLEVVTPDDLAEDVAQAIVSAARTGESDDGKIFIERIADAYRIRTDERGENAI